MRSLKDLLTSSEHSAISFWLCFAFLFLVVLAFHGKPVPLVNEYLYLLRLKPDFLPADWSFSQPANEHWLFNTIFSVAARVVSIEIVGWVGRAASWVCCLVALIKLGRRWHIPFWTIAFSVSLWLAFRQAIVNDEWIFGTFEAKAVAYPCLLFALYQFGERKVVLPSILLGLSFSFHPAVGLWAIPAVVLAVLAAGTRAADLAKVCGLAALFCLPGALPLTLGKPGTATPATFADWEFIVTKHMPYHFDPFYFPAIGVVLVFLMLAFNVVCLWKTESFPLRFLRNFQIALGGFFLFGVALRLLEMYSLLGYMPMRLFPILTPIFFLFTVSHTLVRSGGVRVKAAVVIFAAVVVAQVQPVDKAIFQLRETKNSWRAAPPDGTVAALRWVANNTPPDALIISHPNDRRTWYLSERAQVVSYSYPRYDRLPEWRNRVADLADAAVIRDRVTAPETLDNGFAGLTAEQIEKLRDKYSASYLVTNTAYPFPIVFTAGACKVYKLSEDVP